MPSLLKYFIFYFYKFVIAKYNILMGPYHYVRSHACYSEALKYDMCKIDDTQMEQKYQIGLFVFSTKVMQEVNMILSYKFFQHRHLGLYHGTQFCGFQKGVQFRF